MEQEVYKVAIIRELLKSPMHVRELARRTSTNPMNVTRNLKFLIKYNIVEYKKEGRNKIFALKNNLESKSYLTLCEKHELIRFLRYYPSARFLISHIMSDKRIAFAAILGNHAKMIAQESDSIPLFIGTKDETSKKELLKINYQFKIQLFDSLPDPSKNDLIIIKGAEHFHHKDLST